ncbi:MAG: hypothetical protein NVSMB42_26320 [Herpetosiphon sp.]
MVDWVLYFEQIGWWGQAKQGRLTDVGHGLSDMLAARDAAPFWAVISVLAAFGVPGVARRWPRVLALAAAWLLVFGTFFAWWEGDNSKYWIVSALPLWTVVGLSLTWFRSSATRRPMTLAGFAFVGLLGWHNWGLLRFHNTAANDLQRRYAATLRDHTTPDDLILTPGGPLELYLPYYEGRRHIQTLNQLMIEAHGDKKLAFGLLHDVVQQALSAGYSVVIDQGLITLPPEYERRFPFTRDELERFWEPYRSAWQPVVTENNTVLFWQLAGASQLARSQGWDWKTFDRGWQLVHAQHSSFEGGWCFDPQTDPNLVSPVLNLDASTINKIEVTMAASARREYLQVYYAGPDGTMDDTRSIVVPINGDGQIHTYEGTLAGAAGWTGTITRLRVDPVTAGDGTPASHTCMHQVRLVP